MTEHEQDDVTGTPHVVVVGGGVAGLSAAFFLRDAPVRVTVLESAPRVGGKLAISEVAGVGVDEGAEGLYARRPATRKLLAAAGLGDELVTAGACTTAVWTRGGLRPLPGSQFMGVPADPDDLARSGLVSAEGVARARQEPELPAPERDGDVSVGAYVGGRLGREVLERMVDPFLSDVCAGRPDELSFEAMLTPLAMASRRHPSLTAATASLIPPPPPPGQEIPTGIGTVSRGLGHLPEALADAVLASSADAAVRTGVTVTELERGARGWRLTLRTAEGVEELAADAVVVAVPAGPAAALLGGAAAARLSGIPYTGTLVATLAYPRGSFPERLGELGLAGYRTPEVDGRTVRAVTFSTLKWPHLAGAGEDVDIVRCQAGGVGAEDVLGRDDADLVRVAAAELAEAAGITAAPVASRVNRWADSLPQYTVGHLDRVQRIRDAVAERPGLAVCGAAYDGVGVGNCMGSAKKAADEVLGWLRTAASAREPART